MADIGFSAITGVLGTRLAPRIAKQMQRSCPTLSLLRVEPSNAQDVRWVVETGTGVGTVEADGAAISSFSADTKTLANLGWGIYQDSIQINGLARAAAMAQNNPEELADLVMRELGTAVNRVAKLMGQDLFVGVTSGGWVGLKASGTTTGAIGSTGTYALVNRGGGGSLGQFASNTDANGGNPRPLTFDLMRTMRRKIYTASGLHPNLIVCDPVLYQLYGQLFNQERRWIQFGKLDGGFTTLEFDGIPVVQDINAEAGVMYFLNTDHTYIVQQENPSDAMNGGQGSTAVKGHEEEQLGPRATQLTLRINPLARTGDHIRVQVIGYSQLKAERPNCCGTLVDLPTTA